MNNYTFGNISLGLIGKVFRQLNQNGGCDSYLDTKKISRLVSQEGMGVSFSLG